MPSIEAGILSTNSDQGQALDRDEERDELVERAIETELRQVFAVDRPPGAGQAEHPPHPIPLPELMRRPYSRRMRALGLVALLVYTFGAFAYGAILFLWITQVRSRRWAAREDSCAPAGGEGDGVNGALLAVSLLWFCCNVGLVLFRLVPLPTPWQLDVASVCLAFASTK